MGKQVGCARVGGKQLLTRDMENSDSDLHFHLGCSPDYDSVLGLLTLLKNTLPKQIKDHRKIQVGSDLWVLFSPAQNSVPQAALFFFFFLCPKD